MAPRKSRRRRRLLAAPFVFTVALAPACVPADPPPAQPQPVTQGETRYDQNGNEVTTKPINAGEPAQPAGSGTISEETNSGSKLPPVTVNPPPPDANLPDPPKDAKGKVVTRKDGTCWFHYTVECPPQATCNPPPPKQVKCTK